jgi:hypothetical protein
VLEAAFVLLEFSSPSRRIFIGSHSLPPSLVRRIGPSAPSGANREMEEDFRRGERMTWHGGSHELGRRIGELPEQIVF